ncbi:MAG: phage integrase SAM-like domain-containing protein, partial [Cytophagales bacterium]|nr:phage integrase SAM-like domain-containing protein [Cytophagales bacterium]
MKTNHTFSVLFWINKSKMSNGQAPIYARITVNGKRAELSIKRSIAPDKWNSSNESAKGNSEESRTLNSYINLVRGNIEKHYNQMVSGDEVITAETIKTRYTGKFEKKNTILEAFEYHNKMVESKVGYDVVEATWAKYEHTKRHIANFIKHQYRRTDMGLDELTHKFVVDFDYYLRTEIRVIHNTSMENIKRLKTVITYAITNEWIDRNPFMNFKCSFKEKGRDILTKEELEKLME